MSAELSLCLIVRDEQPYLKRCVESFGVIYDELIIVDTGSTDRTPQIAQELLRHREGRLEHFRWCDDFAAARNYATSFARSEWILMVDADEYLSPDLSPRVILDTIRRTPPSILNLLLTDLTLQEGRVILAHPVNRLFRRHPRVRWTGRIHESLTVRAEEQSLTAITLIHDNAHKRHEDARLRPDVSQMYERGLLADAHASPDNPRPLFYLGNTFAERQQWEPAIAAYRRYLALAGPDGWKEERWQAYLNLAMCYRQLSDDAGSERALLDAVATDPTRSEAHLALGDRAHAAGNLALARTWYQFAATLSPPRSSIFVDLHAYGVKPWWKLSSVLVEQADYPAALAATERALEHSPHDPVVLERLALLRLTQRTTQAPLTVIIPSCTPALARRCLEGLRECEGELYHEVIIVCDGPRAAFEPLYEDFRGVRLTAGRRPFVFARNINLAIEQCEGDVVLLNDDAVPSTPGWLDRLHRAAYSRPDAGPVSPLLSQSGNPAQDMRTALSTRAHASLSPPVVEPTPSVTFVCVYLRRDRLEQVGPLDPGFVWYGWEDNDYCHRARKQGLVSLVDHGVLVRHDAPSSSFRSATQGQQLTQARHYFERKHHHPPAVVDVVMHVRADDPQVLTHVDHLRHVAPSRARLIVLVTGDHPPAIEGLQRRVDPRLVLQWVEQPPIMGAQLERLGSGGSTLVIETSPDQLPPLGWIDALLDAGLDRRPRMGVLALPAVHNPPPRRTSDALDPLHFAEVSVDDPAFARAPAYVVVRADLERFGPLDDSAIPPWVRLAQRMHRHGHISGWVSVPPKGLRS